MSNEETGGTHRDGTDESVAERPDDEDTHPIPDSPGDPIHIQSEDHLQDAIESYDALLVEIFGEFCDVCDLLKPLVSDLAARDNLVVAIIDVEETEPLARSFDPAKLPTFILFSEGEPVERAEGAHDREWFDEFLEAAI